jgi:hypothetical protein
MKTKAQYKVKNWNAYDASLKQRGSITFWVNEETIEQWCNQQKTEEREHRIITLIQRLASALPLRAIATMGTLGESCI